MPESQPANSTRAEFVAKRFPWKVTIFLVGCLVFGVQLGQEPHFVDESAYIAQSYYADLFLSGRVNDSSWLEYGGFDLPPLPKYLTGIALRIGGFSRPGQLAAFAWYANTSKQFVSPEALTVARIPDVLIGALGCVAIYLIGKVAFGKPTGILAAILLMVSPLYWLHARRAMSDVPAEAFMLLSLAVGITCWRAIIAKTGSWRSVLGLSLGSGCLVGLAVSSKLNGTIAGMILASWVILAWLLPSAFVRSKLIITGATLLAGVVSLGVFVELNPFLTAHPTPPIRPDLRPIANMNLKERMAVIRDHRLGVGETAKNQFPDDALKTFGEKASAVLVQGFGRFSPFGPRHSDSRTRFAWSQDWGAVVWIPLVLAGAIIALIKGRAQFATNQPPLAWAIVLGAIVAGTAVTLLIPLAWDRYYISIQPWSVLLASVALTAPFVWGRASGDELK